MNYQGGKKTKKKNVGHIFQIHFHLIILDDSYKNKCDYFFKVSIMMLNLVILYVYQVMSLLKI